LLDDFIGKDNDSEDSYPSFRGAFAVGINPIHGSIGKLRFFLYVVWRHVLQEQDHIIAAKVDDKGGSLVTVSEIGQIVNVRLWNLATGFLVWESLTDTFSYDASISFLFGSEDIVVVTDWDVACITSTGDTLSKYAEPSKATNLKSTYHNVEAKTFSIIGYTKKMVSHHVNHRLARSKG
jgi:hypothetical protein